MQFAELPLWFRNRIKKVMVHNDYDDHFLYAKNADRAGLWSPLDLILREYYNNGGGSSKGFLGIPKAECVRCHDYAVANQDGLHDFYSKRGANNWGITLWDDYCLR